MNFPFSSEVDKCALTRSGTYNRHKPNVKAVSASAKVQSSAEPFQPTVKRFV